jgi:hypothetical protein
MDAGFGSTGEAHQSTDLVPVAIRVPQALVDTVVEPIHIVDAVPQTPTGAWTVG